MQSVPLYFSALIEASATEKQSFGAEPSGRWSWASKVPTLMEISFVPGKVSANWLTAPIETGVGVSDNLVEGIQATDELASRSAKPGGHNRIITATAQHDQSS